MSPVRCAAYPNLSVLIHFQDPPHEEYLCGAILFGGDCHIAEFMLRNNTFPRPIEFENRRRFADFTELMRWKLIQLDVMQFGCSFAICDLRVNKIILIN